MKFQGTMVFLGSTTRESKKTGNPYYLAKFMHEDTQEIYEMYVPVDRVQLVTAIAQSQMFEKVAVAFEMSAFNGKPKVDLVGLKKFTKVKGE